MKKYLLSFLTLAIFAIGFTASDDSESDDSEDVMKEVPANVTHVSVEEMVVDLEQNELKAQQKYKDKWFVISRTLGNMDSDGKYFKMERDPESFDTNGVRCKIPEKMKDEMTNKLMNMSKGTNITVKGKVTDMEEIMGYSVYIVELN